MLALIGVGNGLVIPLIVSGVLQSVPAAATGAASGVLTTTQQFAMTLGIAAVGTLFFAREASAGVVAALQTALLADVGLVAFALAMTMLLPRRPVALPVDTPTPGWGGGPRRATDGRGSRLTSSGGRPPSWWPTRARAGRLGHALPMTIVVDSSSGGIDWARVKADLAADDFDNGRSADALRRSFENSPHVVVRP